MYAELRPTHKEPGKSQARNATESYEAAVAECLAHVAQIEKECHHINEKFTDQDFDIEYDWDNCLEGLTSTKSETSDNNGPSDRELGDALSTVLSSGFVPNDVGVSLRLYAQKLKPKSRRGPSTCHRVDWIFDKPRFSIDGLSTTDVRQGSHGDCWWVSAVATLCSLPDMMDKICVAQNPECGVYGFVFFRDGEWISTVVDDNLFLKYGDYDEECGDVYDSSGEKEREWKQTWQTGSKSLYYAQCADQNETWLPLLEKAYAKVHGDYAAIQSGNSGEGRWLDSNFQDSLSQCVQESKI